MNGLLHSGIDVVLTDQLGITHYEQIRRHHRSKVNKKWRRRYGMRPIYKPTAVMMGGRLFVNPPMMDQIRNNLPIRWAEMGRP